METQLVDVGLGDTSHEAMAHVCAEIAIEKTDLQLKTRQPPSMNGSNLYKEKEMTSGSLMSALK